METPFDRQLRRRRRDRAALSSEKVDYLLRHVGEELLARLDLVNRQFEEALDLGCGSGFLSKELIRRGLSVTSADAGRYYAAAGRSGVQCDEDRLAFADGSFDLVVSVGVLDSVNDLPGALVLIRRALRPDGLFLAAFAGAGSLPRLRAAMQAADNATGEGAAPRIHPQIDVRAAGDLLARAGFTLPVADTDSLEVRYPGLAALVADLRTMGATNILANRSRRPFGRPGFAAAAANFQSLADPGGRITERFQIIYLIGWAPSPNQERAASLGSLTASLATALEKRS
jgi:NADH dehydrogenase [ubiquinone] 1 alpha subcomplex assembly factor 5